MPLDDAERARLRKWAIGIIVAITGVLGVMNFMRGTGPTQFVVTAPSGRQILADAAQTPEEQLLGPFFIRNMPADRGFLLVFDDPGYYHLTTRAMHFPVDLIWLNQSREIIHVERALQPCAEDPCPKFGPQEPDAVYVLQMLGGYAERESLAKGNTLGLKLFRRSG
jgi:uncharacterized membrane protein (UPF0127 family)